MTSDEALEDHEQISIGAAAAELKRHYCRIIVAKPASAPDAICVTNDIDPPEWIKCTPAAIMGWLGY